MSCIAQVATSRREPPCFYKLANFTCAQTSRVVNESGGDEYHKYMTTVLGGGFKPSWITGSTTQHAVGADSQVSKFYNSAKTVSLATEFIGPDLDAFGYEEMKRPPELCSIIGRGGRGGGVNIPRTAGHLHGAYILILESCPRDN